MRNVIPLNSVAEHKFVRLTEFRLTFERLDSAILGNCQLNCDYERAIYKTVWQVQTDFDWRSKRFYNEFKMVHARTFTPGTCNNQKGEIFIKFNFIRSKK